MDTDDALLGEFIIESLEHLGDIEANLLSMEDGGANIDEQLVNKVFRAAHSIKGGAGFFNLARIQELAHRTESVLDLIRSREMVPSPDIVNILLASFDRLRELINHHHESNSADVSELIVALTGLATAHLPAKEKASISTTVKVSAPGIRTVLHVAKFDMDRAMKAGHYLYFAEYDLIDDVQRRGKTPLDVLRHLTSVGEIIESVLDLDSGGTLDSEPTNRLPFCVLCGSVLEPDLADALFDLPADRIHCVGTPVSASSAPAPPPPPPPTPLVVETSTPNTATIPEEQEPTQIAQEERSSTTAKSASAPPDATLRVGISVLESLMNLASELVLGRNQLTEAIAGEDRRAIQTAAQRISMVTTELQEAIMLTRMQPIGNIFGKFPRVVRDVSKDLGKDIRLEISGRDVEMDKTIIEGLSDPLTHMVRNAVDHGIEMPEVRIKAGKPSAGNIHLKAYHEAGQVVLEIVDDGRGIDTQKVGASAVKKGLITQEQLKAMSNAEMMMLIFLPGLSTAEKLSDISGRGVGMDVVKTNLDKLGGKVEIDSEIGKGSTFRIKLPLTLAIIPSLLVSVNKERYAIPQVHVSELIHVAPDQIQRRIEIVGDAEVLVLRGNLIPLVRLSDVLNLDRVIDTAISDAELLDRRAALADRRSRRSGLAASDSPQPRAEHRQSRDRRYHASSGLNIVCLTTGALQYGLIVDELHDTIEIVVKPLGRHLKGLSEYAGATILGDGQVSLILDAAGIAAKEELLSMGGTDRAKEIAYQTQLDESQERHAFVTFRNAFDEYCATPLGVVSRVTQVKDDQIEFIGGKRSMQYRGGSLPLVTLRDIAKVHEIESTQDKAVVMFESNGREVGLLAGMPVDVIETTAEIDHETLRQPGVMGSAIIGGKTTLLIDLFEALETAFPEMLAEREKVKPIAGSAPTVLLAEDSDFFRKQVKRFLEGAGYKVLDAEDGQAAWELLEKNATRVQAVVTDVEMPRLDGLGLTRRIRADNRFAQLPIIAVTSLAAEENMAAGRAAGVTEYQVKLDRDRLLESIARLLPVSHQE